MKAFRIELIFYTFVALGTILLVLFPVITYDQPNTNVPTQVETDQEISVTPDPPTQTPDSQISPIVNTIFTVFIILGVLLIIWVVLRYLSFRRGNIKFRFGQRKGVQEEDIRNLKDAREKAYEIIEKGLKEETYTSSFIDAYLALDESLDSFREIKRPKYWTPKEYAFNVSKPVFKPSVYKFVSIFYDLRYGYRDATRENLINFRKQLDYLFVDEVPTEIRKEWSKIITEEIKSNYEYKIPRIYDHTKPQRRD